MRNLSIGIAIVMLLVGGTFFFQGIGVLPGSVMTGEVQWAIIGAILVVAAVVIIYVALRRKPLTPNQ